MQIFLNFPKCFVNYSVRNIPELESAINLHLHTNCILEDIKMKLLTTLFLLTLACESFALTSQTGDMFKTASVDTHRMKILNHGMASLQERLNLIASAKKSIDLEYFIYRNDLSGKIVTQALVKKAREGVKVRMLLDYFMIGSEITPFIAHELSQYGIEVRYFNTAPTARLLKVQYRNHRKAIIVDSEVAITGGRNIGNEYFDLDPKYNFLDRDVTITGEIVQSIDDTFNKTFYSKESKILKRELMPKANDSKYRPQGDKGIVYFNYERDIKAWNKDVSAAKAFVEEEVAPEVYNEITTFAQKHLDLEKEGTCNNIGFISEYPNLGRQNKNEERLIKWDLFRRIRQAEKKILFDSPYFILNDQFSAPIKEALAKNVEFDVLTNSLNSTDAPYVYAAFDGLITKWIKLGLKPYIFKGHRPTNYDIIESYAKNARFGVHAKTYVFDDRDTYLGTFNVDPRSANFNSEMMIACHDSEEIAKIVSDDIESRREYSFLLDSKEKVRELEFYEIGFSKMIMYYFLKVPSHLLKGWL